MQEIQIPFDPVSLLGKDRISNQVRGWPYIPFLCCQPIPFVYLPVVFWKVTVNKRTGMKTTDEKDS